MTMRAQTLSTVNDLKKFLVDNNLGKEDIFSLQLNASGHYDIIYDGADVTDLDAGTVEGDTGAGATISVDAVAKTFTRAAGSYVTDGFRVGDRVTFSGFVGGGNNSTFTVTVVSEFVLTCAGAAGLVTEAGTADEQAVAVGHYVTLGDGMRLRRIRVTGATGATTLNILDKGEFTILSGDTFDHDWEGRYAGDGTTVAANIIAIGPDASYCVTWLDRS